MKPFRHKGSLRTFLRLNQIAGDFCFYMYGTGPAPHRFRYMYGFDDYTGVAI